MRLSELVSIDNRFEKSVNLLLDLNDARKLDYYIPTRSSVNLLFDYLREVKEFTGKRANILIGPYGKGKSHLLLVLLSLLSGKKSDEVVNLINRITAIEGSSHFSVNDIWQKYRFLPVIINTNNGNLGQAFVKSLNQALKREGLTDVVPDDYFSEAIKTILQWKSIYPETYKLFAGKLEAESIDDFIRRLEVLDEDALTIFRKLHPLLTSGSEFNPLIDDDPISVYKSVNRNLCEKHGFTGIYIVFDEFSKYIEGHTEEGFSSDMKVLQDICELCNASKSEQLHLTCVAHKAIRSYGDALSKEVRNAFRGVEGRLVEIPFLVSSQNNYELIADAIMKTKLFYKWCENEQFMTLINDTYRVPEYSALFTRNDFNNIVGNGCYPLAPLSVLLLLNICEKVAQNERTIFTFLAGKDINSLVYLIDKLDVGEYVGADSIYNYFEALFEADKTSSIHSVWLKAQHMLTKAETFEEGQILKTVAVIQMINNTDDIPAKKELIRLALGWSEGKFNTVFQRVLDNHLLAYKRSLAAYDFPNTIGTNIENEVNDCALKYYSKIDVPTVINNVMKKRYILPKKYNQMYSMTRYYRVLCISNETFMSLASFSYLKDENIPDGYLLLVSGEDRVDRQSTIDHLIELNDKRLVIGFIDSTMCCNEWARTLLAANRLLESKEYIEQNEIIVTELNAIQNEMIININEWLEREIESLPEVYAGSDSEKISKLGINRALSDICEAVYCKSPVINHELINRHNISAQISKARNSILDDLLKGRLVDKYSSGSSAESTIYRAVYTHTEQDKNLKLVRAEILAFIHESKGRKNSFDKIVKILTSPPIGLRKGVIPFYLIEQLVELVKLENMPVVYLGKKELPVDPSVMSNIVSRPEEYSLYIEEETEEKLKYIEGLEKIFSEYGNYCREIDNRNRLSKLACTMQSWFRSLPQTAQIFIQEDYPGQSIKEIVAFRRLFSGTINPRELIFDQIPKVLEKPRYPDALTRLIDVKTQIDNHVHLVKEKVVTVIQEELKLDKNDDLFMALRSWYMNLSDVIKNSLFSRDSQRIFQAIKENKIRDVEEIAEKISKEAVGLFIEDWNDSTIAIFRDAMHALIEEIETKENESDSFNAHKIMVSNHEGVEEKFYNYDPDNISVSGHFFMSALDDLIEEYGESVETNEKIGILMAIVQKLMG